MEFSLLLMDHAKLIYFFMPENIQSMNMEGALISSQALPSARGTARVCAESMVVIIRLTRELAISFLQSCIGTSSNTFFLDLDV